MTDRPIWDDGTWPGFPELTNTVATDLCVVGLGGSGLRALETAIGLGLSVVGIDAGSVAGGAAGRNGGFLLAGMASFYHDARAHYGAEVARRFYSLTLAELQSIFGDDGSRRTGSLRIAASDHELTDIERELEALRSDGFAAEWYEGPEGAGLMVPDNGVCNPMRRLRDLACRLADEGARLHESSPALSIEPGKVVTPLGVIEAEHVLVAVDGGLETVIPELKGRVRTASLQMLATEPDHEVTFPRPVYTNFGHDYFQQLPDGSVALGGGRDRYAEASWTTAQGLIDEVQSFLDTILKRFGVTAPVSTRWSGRAAWTEDDRPIMEEVRPGVVVIGAYSGHGNVVGSIYGRLAVEAIAAGKPIESPL